MGLTGSRADNGHLAPERSGLIRGCGPIMTANAMATDGIERGMPDEQKSLSQASISRVQPVKWFAFGPVRN